jgi:hypothetical protein
VFFINKEQCGPFPDIIWTVPVVEVQLTSITYLIFIVFLCFSCLGKPVSSVRELLIAEGSSHGSSNAFWFDRL